LTFSGFIDYNAYINFSSDSEECEDDDVVLETLAGNKSGLVKSMEASKGHSDQY
jgi:hypothetical protein